MATQPASSPATGSPTGGGGWNPLNNAGESVTGGGGAFDMIGKTIGALNLLKDAANFVASQRNAAAYYQNIEGINNLGGQDERLKGTAYQARKATFYTTEEAIAAFKGVTALGYNDLGGAPRSRQDALSFLETGKANWGQSVAEGLQTLQIASKTAKINFGELSAALDDISKTAGKAGVNAQMARAQFLGAMDAAVASGYGGGSTTAAALLTRTAASYGQEYAQNVDNTGVLSASRRYMVAARYGMTQAQAVNMQRKNPAQWMALNSQVDQAQIYESFSGAFTQAVRDGIAKAGGASALKGKDGASISAQIGFDAAESANENTDALVAVASGLSGRTWPTPDAAMTWIVNNIAGLGEVGFTTTTAATPGANVPGAKTSGMSASQSASRSTAVQASDAAKPDTKGMSAKQSASRSDVVKSSAKATAGSKKTSAQTKAAAAKTVAKESVSSKSSPAASAETNVKITLSSDAKKLLTLLPNSGGSHPNHPVHNYAKHMSKD